MGKKSTRYIIIISGSLVILIVFLVLSVELTSNPAFCSTCHYMEPYVEGWKTSTHADVTCTDCHFPPGFKSKIHGKFTAISMVVNYMTGIYKKSKPWAEIEDRSCLRSGCHVERLLNGRVSFKEDIIFDHEPHLTRLRRNKKLRCTSCHSQIVQGEHITVTESSCFLCHFKNQPKETPIDDCTWCHEAPIATGFSEVKYNHLDVITRQIDCQKCHGNMQMGDGSVPVERCSGCHAELGKIEMISDIDFIHQTHVTDHKVECQNCHLVIQHKSVSRTADIMPDCQGCHENIHTAQIGLFSGQGGKGVTRHPDPMFDVGLNCQACHIFHQADNGLAELGDTRVARGQSCEKCHGTGFSRLLDQWENVMQDKISLLEKSFAVVDLAIERSEDPVASARIQEIVKEARYNFMLVKQGNAVHNVVFSDELLLSSHEYLMMALREIDPQSSLPDLHVFSTMIPSECKNCHYGIEEIDVNTFGIQFSHNKHIVKNELPCSSCHSNVRQHGELIMTREDCLSCHHETGEHTCDKCHTVQSQLYSGTWGIADHESADVMFEAEVECRSCHEGETGMIQAHRLEACTDCHDEEYGEMVKEWQDQTRASILDLESRMTRLTYSDLSKENRQYFDSIEEGLALIKTDNSQGVHNIEMITETVHAYQEILEKILE